jgi:ABC-type transporter Mla subunit MlaD
VSSKTIWTLILLIGLTVAAIVGLSHIRDSGDPGPGPQVTVTQTSAAP